MTRTSPNPAVPTLDSVNIMQFDGIGDGRSDDTAALLGAATYLKAQNGAGTIMIPPRPFVIQPGTLLPDNIHLAGTMAGPFDTEQPPLTPATTKAPTLLCLDPSAPFLTTGEDGRIENLQIYHPNQAGPTASAPIAYPPTITLGSTGGVRGLTLVNSYFGINVGIGRTLIHDCKIGSFAVAIRCEEVSDVVNIRNVMDGVFYTTIEGGAGPTLNGLAGWALQYGIAFDIGRADGLFMSDITTFWKQAGIRFRDTTMPALPGDAGMGSPTSGYAKIVNADFDTVQYGGIFQSTNNIGGGVKIANWDIGSCNGMGKAVGQTAIYLQTGGNSAPELIVTSGSVRGTWAYGPKVVQAGNARTSMRGIDF